MVSREDTIAAISTAAGEAGIAVVRMSGPRSLEIADVVFSSPSGKEPSMVPSHTVHFGYIELNGERIDGVLLTVFRAPASYTGEDVVEISCHGGTVVTQRILGRLLDGGARLAAPGEFTKRAFLNGRIDLVQAEAVIELIRAKTDRARDCAMRLLDGALSGRIEAIRKNLLNILAALEAGIEFPEEGIEPPSAGDITGMIDSVMEMVEDLVSTAREGKVLREGVKAVIAGKPNVGKSSLLNALLREKRAIVTSIPGTTTDTIEEIVSIGGIPLSVVDTAGFGRARDVIQVEGMKRAEASIEEGSIVIVVFDASVSLDDEDSVIAEKVRGKKTVVVVNKVDLPEKLDREELARLLGHGRLVDISMENMSGIAELKKAISDAVWEGAEPASKIAVSERHRKHLEAVLGRLREARSSADGAVSSDFTAMDLKGALDGLDRITGRKVTGDILDRIFSRFCIGK